LVGINTVPGVSAAGFLHTLIAPPSPVEVVAVSNLTGVAATVSTQHGLLEVGWMIDAAVAVGETDGQGGVGRHASTDAGGGGGGEWVVPSTVDAFRINVSIPFGTTASIALPMMIPHHRTTVRSSTGAGGAPAGAAGEGGGGDASTDGTSPTTNCPVYESGELVFTSDGKFRCNTVAGVLDGEQTHSRRGDAITLKVGSGWYQFTVQCN
jgi:hypothetical protein